MVAGADLPAQRPVRGMVGIFPPVAGGIRGSGRAVDAAVLIGAVQNGALPVRQKDQKGVLISQLVQQVRQTVPVLLGGDFLRRLFHIPDGHSGIKAL